MSEQTIQEFAATKGFHSHTQQRWLSWKPQDGAALLNLALALKAGENHLRDLMDWLEEISMRDGVAIQDVLGSEAITRIKTDPRLGRADRLKRVKDQIRRLRFPRLSQLEDSIQSKIRALKLQPNVKLSVPPGLEGGDLRVEFSVGSPAQLKSILAKLNEASECEFMTEIFVLLKGDASAEKPKPAR
ncbi:MAG: hypothetical protein WD688_05745 [Candidatus Binatia bacterium]